MITWRVIQCTSGQEARASDVLAEIGYDGAWYPQKRVTVRPRGSQARKQGKPRSILKPWVPGYVFIPHDEISVHRINQTRGNLTMRVLAPGGIPCRLTDSDMSKMRDMPERLKAMLDDIRRKEIEEYNATRPIVGQKARVTSGPFEGQSGYVVDRRGQEYALDLGLVRVRLDGDILERLAT